MKRSYTRDAASRAYLGISRGTLRAANDDPKMQEVEIDVLHGEKATKVEYFHDYGYSSRPLDPVGSGDEEEAAEVVVAYVQGNRSHPIVLKVGDRRYRLKGLEKGEVALHDDQGQKVHLKRDGIEAVSGNSKVSIKNGEMILDAGGLKSSFKPDKISLGDLNAAKKVMLEDGTPAEKVYAK